MKDGLDNRQKKVGEKYLLSFYLKFYLFVSGLVCSIPLHGTDVLHVNVTYTYVYVPSEDLVKIFIEIIFTKNNQIQ